VLPVGRFARLTSKGTYTHARASGHSEFTDQTKHDVTVDMTLPGADGLPVSQSQATVDGSRKINGVLYKQLLDMEFAPSRVKHCLLYGCTTVESAVGWLSERMDDASLDVEPEGNVIIDETPVKAPLTEEEKAQKVAEMKARLAEKKAQKAEEDRLTAIEKEKERIANQRMMAEQRALAEEQKRKNAYEQMRREKEADKKAREKVQVEMAVDKAVRKGEDPHKARADALAEIQRKNEEAEARLAQPHPVASTAGVNACAAPPVQEWNLGAIAEPPQVPLWDNVRQR